MESLRKKIDKAVEKYVNNNNEQIAKTNIKKEGIIEIKNNVLDLLGEEFGSNIMDLDNNYIKGINSKIYQTKKRWRDKEMEDSSLLMKKVKKVSLLYETAPDISEKFSKLYGAANPDAFKKHLLDQLDLWYYNNNAFLIGFEYIEDKHNYQVERAIFNDIQKLISLEVILYRKNTKKSTLEMPEALNSVAFNFSRDKNMKNSMKLSNKKNHFRYVYQIDDDSAFETIIGAEALKSDIISEVLRNGITNVLNAYDMKVFLYVISQRGSNFFVDGKIAIPLVDIVKVVFPSDSSTYYEKCRISLHKMAYQRFSVLTKNSRGLTVGILDSVYIGKNNKQGQEMVELTISEAIVSDLLKRRTMKIYEDSFLKLKEPASQVLIFKLQSRRVSHFSQKSNKAKSESVPLDISFFRNSLYFSNSRVYENIKVIERSMNEMVSNSLIVKDYKRQGYTFYVSFLPLTEEERRDLLEENKEEVIAL